VSDPGGVRVEPPGAPLKGRSRHHSRLLVRLRCGRPCPGKLKSTRDAIQRPTCDRGTNEVGLLIGLRSRADRVSSPRPGEQLARCLDAGQIHPGTVCRDRAVSPDLAVGAMWSQRRQNALRAKDSQLCVCDMAMVQTSRKGHNLQPRSLTSLLPVTATHARHSPDADCTAFNLRVAV
jgi:hypothetical protein